MAEQIKIKQVKSTIGCPQNQRRVVKALGLRGIGSQVVQKDNNCIRGMVNKVKHLLAYELVQSN